MKLLIRVVTSCPAQIIKKQPLIPSDPLHFKEERFEKALRNTNSSLLVQFTCVPFIRTLSQNFVFELAAVLTLLLEVLFLCNSRLEWFQTVCRVEAEKQTFCHCA